MITEYSLTNPEFLEPIPVNYYNNQSEKLLIFVGGSGDDKDKFNDLLEYLAKSGFKSNFLTFTPRGMATNKPLPLKQQAIDLNEVLHFIISNFDFSELDLFATSMGAFSTSMALTSPLNAAIIKKILLFDPADFYLNKSHLFDGGFIWDGHVTYNPTTATVAGQLKNISGPVKIDVAHLTLKNFTRTGYVEITQRGIDHKKAFPRLNSKMVKAFYINLPDLNKGKYQEIPEIPHAFMRDGNIKQNIEKVAKIISNCFNID